MDCHPHPLAPFASHCDFSPYTANVYQSLGSRRHSLLVHSADKSGRLVVVSHHKRAIAGDRTYGTAATEHLASRKVHFTTTHVLLRNRVKVPVCSSLEKFCLQD